MKQTFDPTRKSQIGLLGLGVMGSNLCRNLLDHDFRVAAYDPDPANAHSIAGDYHDSFRSHSSIDVLLGALQSPRCLLLMLPAGNTTDTALESLLGQLSPGDMVVDLGNSHYRDSERRLAAAADHDIRFVGCGISGGSQGARYGAALMPSGDRSAWPELQPVFTAIAAQHRGEPCVSWIGPGGSGHFVKTVHNGIEYADMQLIAESYHLLRSMLELDCDEIGRQFESWNRGELSSYLVEITSVILQTRDTDGSFLVDRIVDRAGQKGTGNWTSVASLEYAVPATLLAESVYARMLSARKAQRLRLAGDFPHKSRRAGTTLSPGDIEKALYGAKIIAYAQGFDLLRQASSEHDWELNLASIAAGWRAGCVIRGRLLEPAMQAFIQDPGISLVEAEVFRPALDAADDALRSVVKAGVDCGIPLAAFGAALTWLDALRCERLPANLIQAQRDYFGAHGYERFDSEPGVLHHFSWHQESGQE